MKKNMKQNSSNFVQKMFTFHKFAREIGGRHKMVVIVVVMVGILGYDVFRYYQYKLENPRPSEAVEAYEETSLLPLKDYQRKRILTFLAPKVDFQMN